MLNMFKNNLILNSQLQNLVKMFKIPEKISELDKIKVNNRNFIAVIIVVKNKSLYKLGKTWHSNSNYIEGINLSFAKNFLLQ